jgi:tRNA A-37 threonylcarbamoyl transferase component Bud32
MQDRDLIVGVLAAQAGFATPSQVLTAAAAALVDAESDSLLTRLERTGALSQERRKVLEALAEQAFQARNGDPRAVATSLGGVALLETLVSAMGAAPAETDAQPSIGPEVPLERPGQYTRLHELGRGSQSVVRAARDEIVGREVALKELAPTSEKESDSASSRAARARFLREVRLVAGLDHLGIVAVHELARREDGTLFCAQKLIRGETLQARLARCRSLGDRLRLVRHVLDACQAVAYAHAKSVVHRDLKPSNVMVGEYGETVVVDWGLAKRREEAEEVVPLPASAAEPGLTLAGAALGTPAYMSPEQARGDIAAIDARSDVFSLGAVLYQVLTGRPPFEGATSDHILENVRAGNFAPVRVLTPDAPPELAAIAERALRPEPTERYPDAEALAQELSTFLAGGRVRAYQYAAWELARKFAVGHRALTTGLAVAVGALLVSAIVVGFRLQMTRRDLARSFIERAHAAERESDWAQAAAYFAAARTQQDTPEARWGLALAGERAVERVVSFQGGPGSFTDVGVLPDGRIVVLGVTANRVEVRELDGGKTLWSRDSEPIAAAVLLPGGQVRLTLQGGWAFFDAATGTQLAMFDRDTVGRPCPGRFPTPVTVFNGQLIKGREGGTSATLATDVGSFDRCVVSDDGREVAYEDTSGKVHLLSVDDGRGLGERTAAGLRNLLFSKHGLVMVGQGWLDVLGGPEGDFSLGLAEPASRVGKWDRPAFGTQSLLGGAAVSPDGHLVAVARIGSSRADVVDLRTRVVRGTVHYAEGWPRFAFSLDGQRVFAAGLRGASQLDAWRLPSDDAPTGHPGKWVLWSMVFSPTGRQMAIINASKHELELHGAHGELLTRDPVSVDLTQIDAVRDGLIVLYDRRAEGFTLRDVEQHRDVWNHRCRSCPRFQVSEDGSRLVQFGLNGLEVWDARANRVLFTETARVSGFETFVSISPDGRRVAWIQRAAAHVRELDSGRERAFRLDGPGTQVGFGPDSRRLAVITSRSFSLWDAAAGKALWTVRHRIPDKPFELRWSPDAGSLLVRYAGLGAELLDAGNGARLARFPASGTVAPLVSPDVRTKLVASDSNWDLRPLPQPVSESPAESLARTLRRTGLALEGVELVAAP